MIAIDINPVEVIVGELSAGIGRRLPMKFDDSAFNLGVKAPPYRPINVIHVGLILPLIATIPTVCIRGIQFEFPWIDEMQFLGRGHLQSQVREVALVDSKFGTGRSARQATQEPAPRTFPALQKRQNASGTTEHKDHPREAMVGAIGFEPMTSTV